MINGDGSSTSAHKSKCLWVVNPILIDKSPQPCYRLNPNSYIDLLQPDHLVGGKGGLDHTTNCARDRVSNYRIAMPQAAHIKGQLVYKRTPARSQLRSL